MVNLQIKNKMIFMNHVVDQYTSKIQGIDKNKIINNHPEDEILVGKLSPEYITDDPNSSSVDINRLGMDFFIDEETFKNGSLIIKPIGEFYYRVNPTLDEQRRFFLEEAKISFNKDFKSLTELAAFLKSEKMTFSKEILPVFKKLSIENITIPIKFKDFYDSEKNIGYYSTETDSNHALNLYIENLIDNVTSSEELYSQVRDNISIEQILDEHKWRTFITSYEKIGSPSWKIFLEVEIKKLNDFYKISVSIKNAAEDERRPNKKSKKDKFSSKTLFNSGIEVSVENGQFKSIELPYFMDDYKYNKEQYAIGHNCTVLESINTLKTTHIPIFEQKRLKTRDDIKVYFDKLISDPVTELNVLYEEMIKEYDSWVQDFENQKKRNLLTKDGEIQFSKEIDNFKREIDRFKNGIRVIHEFSIVKESFILMNKAFKASSKGYETWRLFQIVFIVSNIPDVCSTEYGEDEMGPNCRIDSVDLLYFPTGGGKTEAFLGITIFNLFFDRFRDKNEGVTAIIKYPLRLLSVQQVQRLADILATSEILRRSNEDIKESEEFSLGFFVGDNNTPNKITETIAEKFKSMPPEDLTNEYQIIDVCPFCKNKSIQVELLQKELRLVHKCTTVDCKSNGILPFYMVDREIYRYLPSVIISTIDKFASVGVQLDFRNILGNVTSKCTDHGFTSRKVCTEREICKDSSKLIDLNLKDPGPTLFIQDELHLIRESLGVYDAHYESFIQYFLNNLAISKKKIKLIGATATISSYESQIYHLYLKNAVRFPSESPYLNRNFYAEIDEEETHRKIIGYAPFGKAIINSVVYSLKYLKEILWEYYKNPNLILSIPGIVLKDTAEALKLLEDYWIFLEYNNVKLDGNKVLSALDDPINTELNRANIQQFIPRKMTGDDSFQDVRKILNDIETTTDVFNGLNLIAATSMISHGVDADKFNIMFFYGMPGNTAEYIQAYSRVGRKHPGIVFMIMRPTREKDQSYLKNFIKFHEFKDILVEQVPINRWAMKAIERTFPGILSAILLSHYDLFIQKFYGYNIYMMSNLQKAILDGLIDKDELTNHLKFAYQCDISMGIVYSEWIETAVNKFYDLIVLEDYNPKVQKDMYITQGIEALGFLRPMNSLRDTDTPIIVEMK